MYNLLRMGLLWFYFAAYRKFGKTKPSIYFNVCGMVAFALTFLKHLERGNPWFMKRSALCGIKMCARQTIIDYFKRGGVL